MGSDMFEAKQSETEENIAASATGAEGKAAASEGKKPAEDAKKPAKKKKIIIVTGSNTQGGQRGAYSSGSGAYNPGGNASQGASGTNRSGGQGRGGNRSAGSGTAQGGRGRQQRPADGRTGDRNTARDGGRNARGANAGRGKSQAAPVHKLIKPTIRQTQMEVDYRKPVQQPRKSDAARKAEAEAEARKAAEAAAAAQAEAAAKEAAEAARKAEEAAAKEAEARAAAEAEAKAAEQKAAEAASVSGAAKSDKTRQDRPGTDAVKTQQTVDQNSDSDNKGGRSDNRGGARQGGDAFRRAGFRVDQQPPDQLRDQGVDAVLRAEQSDSVAVSVGGCIRRCNRQLWRCEQRGFSYAQRH